MRLLHTGNFRFKEFIGVDIPPYAIVSHRWSGEEVSHQDFLEDRQSFLQGQCKSYGWLKIAKGCEIASINGFEWLWIDTICINKQSSAELSEAINSMFQWYKRSDKCYVFLPDVYPITNFNEEGSMTQFSVEEFKSSQWFTRAWTYARSPLWQWESQLTYVYRLQELIAPREVLFFNCDFQLIGNKEDLSDHVSKVTGISESDFGQAQSSLTYVSVATRMRWASNRTATRPEDMAYSLLGIFDINMPLLYGEAEKAFQRLQIEIIRQSDDESIFIWKRRYLLQGLMRDGLLAPNAGCFSESIGYSSSRSIVERQHYEVTNKGVRIICNMPKALVNAFSKGKKKSAVLLMPLNAFSKEIHSLGRESAVPCLKFTAFRSYRASGQVKFFIGQREDLEAVIVPEPFDISDIKRAAERLIYVQPLSWDAFCGNDDADHTAIPVYFPLPPSSA